MKVVSLGEEHRARGDFEAAKAFYEHALEIFEQAAPHSAGVGLALLGIGQIHAAHGELERAKPSFERAVEILEPVAPASTAVAMALHGLGMFHRGRGDSELARVNFERALTLFQGAPEEGGMELVRMGEARRVRGDLDAATVCYEHALQVFEHGASQSAGAGLALQGLGQIHGAHRELDRARESFERALEILEKALPDSAPVAMALHGLGMVHQDRGDLEGAERNLERALTLFERVAPRSDMVADSLVRLGSICNARGDLEAVEDAYGRAVEIYERTAPESVKVAGLYLLLGQTRMVRGDLEDATQSIELALGIFERLAPDSREVGRALSALGRVHGIRGDLEKARRSYGLAIELLERAAPESNGFAVTLTEAAGISYMSGDWEQAQRELDRAVGILERIAPESEQLGTAHFGLGMIWQKRGQLEEAEQSLGRARGHLERVAPSSDNLAATLHLLGRICVARRDLDGATRSFERELEILERSAPQSQFVVRSLADLGSLHRAQGALEQAIGELERAVEVTESLRARAGSTSKAREELFAQHQNPFQVLIAALAQRDGKGDAEAAFAYAERSRARALVELLAERRVEIRADTPEEEERQQALLAEERSIQHRLASAYNRLATARSDPGQAEHVPELEAEESELAGKLDKLRERIGRKFKAYAEIEYPDPLDVEGAQELLEPGTLLLEYDATGEEAFLWALRQDEFRMLPLEASGERIAELVEAAVGPYRRGEDAPAGADEARAELSRLLLAPVPEDFWAGAKRLLVVPDGALHYLPFEILPAPGGGSLIDRHPLAYAPSATALASILADERPRTERRQFVGFGDPQFDGGGEEGEAERRFASRGVGLSPLRATRKEVERIAQGFSGEAPTYLGAEATEYRAKRETEGARFVHFSTHGLLDDRNPLYSGLAFSPPRPEELEADEALDDCLQVYEMFGLRLSAEAVVCSACQTGLGTIHAGEGLVGMSRALFFAGARCVVVSLWPVPNVLTARLMERFYSELQTRPVAEALRDAKLAVRKRYPDPFNWAAFVAVGVGW